MLTLVTNTVCLSHKAEEGCTTCTIVCMRAKQAFSDQDPGARDFVTTVSLDTLLENTNAYYMLNNHLEG